MYMLLYIAMHYLEAVHTKRGGHGLNETAFSTAIGARHQHGRRTLARIASEKKEKRKVYVNF